MPLTCKALLLKVATMAGQSYHNGHKTTFAGVWDVSGTAGETYL